MGHPLLLRTSTSPKRKSQRNCLHRQGRHQSQVDHLWGHVRMQAGRPLDPSHRHNDLVKTSTWRNSTTSTIAPLSHHDWFQDVRLRRLGALGHGRCQGGDTREGVEVHEHLGQPQHGQHGLGESLHGGVRGRHASSPRRPLCSFYPHSTLDLERKGRIQKGLEQPGLLQGPLVFGN